MKGKGKVQGADVGAYGDDTEGRDEYEQMDDDGISVEARTD